LIPNRCKGRLSDWSNNTGDEDDAVEPGSDAEEALLGYKRPVKKGPALI
jgi:hypothetical protein